MMAVVAATTSNDDDDDDDGWLVDPLVLVYVLSTLIKLLLCYNDKDSSNNDKIAFVYCFCVLENKPLSC